jgi:hypothetical protein
MGKWDKVKKKMHDIPEDFDFAAKRGKNFGTYVNTIGNTKKMPLVIPLELVRELYQIAYEISEEYGIPKPSLTKLINYSVKNGIENRIFLKDKSFWK